MVAAVRQTVIVQPGGVVEVRSPELHEGTQAEVIVLIENSGSVASKLAALDRLQESLTLDDAKAQAWVQEACQERQSFGRRE